MIDRDKKIEMEARRIALDHDLDPDDARLGYPAWRIPWILEKATKIVDDIYIREQPCKNGNR